MTIVSIEEINKELLVSRAIFQIPYSVFSKTWYDHINEEEEVHRRVERICFLL